MLQSSFQSKYKRQLIRKGLVLSQCLLAHFSAFCLLALPMFSTVTLAQEKNAAKKAFVRHGGNALKKTPIDPGPKTFDALGTQGAGTGQPGPANGFVNPLGASSSPNTASFGIPTFAPPGISAPPIVDVPIICPRCPVRTAAFRCGGSSGGCSPTVEAVQRDGVCSGSGGEGSGDGAGGQGGAGEILSQIGGQVLGQLLGGLLGGGGGGGQNQPENQPQPPQDDRKPKDYDEDSDEEEVSSSPDPSFIVRVKPRNSSTSPAESDIKISRKLNSELSKQFSKYRDGITVPLRRYSYTYPVDAFRLDGFDYRIVDANNVPPYGCIGDTCDYELGSNSSASLFRSTTEYNYRVCRRSATSTGSYDCWREGHGFRVLGNALKRNQSLTAQQKAEFFKTALSKYAGVEVTQQNVTSSLARNAESAVATDPINLNILGLGGFGAGLGVGVGVGGLKSNLPPIGTPNPTVKGQFVTGYTADTCSDNGTCSYKPVYGTQEELDAKLKEKEKEKEKKEDEDEKKPDQCKPLVDSEGNPIDPKDIKPNPN